jgi:hypothetical protein
MGLYDCELQVASFKASTYFNFCNTLVISNSPPALCRWREGLATRSFAAPELPILFSTGTRPVGANNG